MKNKFIVILMILIASNAIAQSTINISVNANTVISVMPPIWRDHYEVHLLAGHGMNPINFGPHTQYITDPAFSTEMTKLKPRFIRVSLGRMDNPPDTNYFSTNTTALRNLPYEFYKGGNTITDANTLSNYDFSYIDSMIRVVQSMGAQPLITMDYMPFTLSSDTIPNYDELVSILYNLGYNNTIRNSPPSDSLVYGRVIYQLIKHCYTHYGVTYFEHWNEPDQQWLNPVFAHFFYTGNEYQLYSSYAAIADEVSADTSLSNHIKLGGCSFALYSLFQLVPIHFLQLVQANNKKFDFLSFHPYSDTQWRGGYDSAKVSLVSSWRNTYTPGAELIVAEWGRIDPNANVWGDLDYGLYKCCHIIDMLNRNIAMANDVCLFDASTSKDNYHSLGMYRVGSIVPKPSAYAAYNMNEMNDALNRLPLTINDSMYALAGRSDNNDKIVIIFPAEKPISGNNTVHLTVNNIQWNGSYNVVRYELTEASYQSGVVLNQTMAGTFSGSLFADTLSYSAVDSSGRMIIWELTHSSTSSVQNSSFCKKAISVFPNPSNSVVYFSSSANIQLFNHFGQLIEKRKNANEINIFGLPSGVYLLRFTDDKGVIIQQEKIVRQ